MRPEIVRMASFSWESNLRGCALWEQYSAGAYTKALSSFSELVE